MPIDVHTDVGHDFELRRARLRVPIMMREANPDSESFSDLACHWSLDPTIIFLNHGSFGACPRVVLDAQQALRDRIERDPMHFFKRELELLLDQALHELSQFLGTHPDRLAFVPNTTTGINAVLRSLRFEPGDELLTTTHAYNACRNALEFVAKRANARVTDAAVPFPIASAEQVIDAVQHAITPRTRLVLLDHITSSTGLIFPIERLIHELKARGMTTLVDGAHAPGMVPLDLEALGATFYVGNCHKWLCAPKGSAFLYVSPQQQSLIHPVSISHGANSLRTDRSRFRLEFDWTGTDDPSAYLTVPVAIRFLGSLLPGGWPAVRARTRSLALEARHLLCHELGLEIPCPDDMIGSLAAIPLPDATADSFSQPWTADPLQEALYARFRVEVPVSAWPAPPKRLIRISAHLYNNPPHYVLLAQALKELLAL